MDVAKLFRTGGAHLAVFSERLGVPGDLERGGAHLDSRNIALELPTSGRDPTLVHME